MSLEQLDSLYFAKESWADRLKGWLDQHADRPFLSANADTVEVIARRRDMGLRMGVNIPAYALLLFLRDQRYKNAYERRPDAGGSGAPSSTRRQVDAVRPSALCDAARRMPVA